MLDPEKKLIVDIYKIVCTDLNETLIEMDSLESDENVKKYIELMKKREALEPRKTKFHRLITRELGPNCDHIWVLTGDSTSHYGCVKCGREEEIPFDILEPFGDSEKRLFRKKKYYYGTFTDIPCNLELAQAIYSKIAERFPETDTETVIQYLRTAILSVKRNRVKSRGSRLLLGPKFDSWN